MKKEGTDISALTKPIGSFFRRFHTILFFLGVSGGLFAAILMLLGIISLSDTQAPSSDQAVNGTFDETTIEQIQKGTSIPDRPTNRVNPFVE